jgi:hypothetical protein
MRLLKSSKWITTFAGILKSITWLECEHAHTSGKEVLAFIIDENYRWPPERREAYKLAKAIEEGGPACRRKDGRPLQWSGPTATTLRICRFRI